MNKKGIIFLLFSTAVFILSIYIQIFYLNNDYTQLNTSMSFGNINYDTQYNLSVSDDTKIYIDVNYKSPTGEAEAQLRNINTQELVFHKTGEDISLVNQILELSKGDYMLDLNTSSVAEGYTKLFILYNTQDVNIKDLSKDNNINQIKE